MGANSAGKLFPISISILELIFALGKLITFRWFYAVRSLLVGICHDSTGRFSFVNTGSSWTRTSSPPIADICNPSIIIVRWLTASPTVIRLIVVLIHATFSFSVVLSATNENYCRDQEMHYMSPLDILGTLWQGWWAQCIFLWVLKTFYWPLHLKFQMVQCFRHYNFSSLAVLYSFP